ncbi:MAG: hypothetical protein E5W15_06965 [Mesorhizobium sp.]|uniref:hypothetical protein n=1 Tax=unclassified Mesorhizobium TaxID=325217 RepID=UPI000FCA4DC8|nr:MULTISPECIES: hypothetical protein [unclassified Mesorhizobium]RUW43002.1 hypothetical protein EOA37_02290 [Mesorhizobium sp. M2A.F.Ca.ET.015.02.1.1]RVC93051.1 hypothetical protein EN739_22890 [Mesorhizobium sp. M2A.F.Ca.ET.017.03.2.1]RVD04440.1 hypothetical protein EN753_20555 [Mesorhizobium sp. M2A.F.Ca.ET.029.05.1.1]RWB47590.1 MAG: hypothetical protein EOQ46_06040 [Mesorhizobium sp.]RWB57395.1 MAG: hypothetical protein EOQ48_26030 [Mesorhizobium sp.]
MAFNPGDIVLFESGVAGKMKFHLCICVQADTELHSFIYLNSEGGFRDQFVIDCARIPEVGESRTGDTVFDCPTVHRKSTAKLAGLRAKFICVLPKDVAAEFLPFARRITSMVPADHQALIAMLEALSA